MDKLLRTTIKTQMFKVLAFCLVGVLLFLIEQKMAGRAAAIQQIFCIVGLSGIFFAMGLMVNSLYLSLVRKGSKQLMGFFLLCKLARFVVAVVFLVIYALADGSNLLLFAINLLVIYLVEMVLSVMYYARVERNTPKINEKLHEHKASVHVVPVHYPDWAAW